MFSSRSSDRKKLLRRYHVLNSGRRRRLFMESLEDRRLLAIDLQPYANNGGRTDSIVISTSSGTTTDATTITSANTIYVDYYWANFGSTGSTSFNTRLLLDGSSIAAWSSTLPAGTATGITDSIINPLSVGSHTLQLEVDYNNSNAESNESNNIRTKTFNVVAAGTEDFGDAPSAAQSGFASSYPTLIANNGARHTPMAGFSIGSQIDTEADGQPNATASQDDTAGTPDDEDGVTFVGTTSVGNSGSVQVFVTNTALVANPHLDMWIDFDRDGDWDEVNEHIFTGAAVAGTNTLNFTVPVTASAGLTYARFRLYNGTTPLAVTGLINNGEVEDHMVNIATPVTWVGQGPAATENGQLEPNTSPNRRVTGAIHTVLAHPTNPDILYIGAVNGGIWKTTNATATIPTWTPQTDFNSSLSLGAMAFDPTDATNSTLVAGASRYSSFASIGGYRGVVYRTTNGGTTWTELGSNGLKAIGGENISGIASRGDTIVVTSSGNSGGVFRSTNGGANFSAINSADFTSNNHDFTDLVVDPSDGTGQRMYAASGGSGGSSGIYRSDNFGSSWTKISTGNSTMNSLVIASNNIEMAIHPTTGRLYVATLVSGQPRGVFYTNDGIAATPIWTQMDVPVLPLSGGVAITGATNATPIVITSNAHGLAVGNFVVINGVTGNTAANGFYRVSAVTTNTFTLDSSVGNGNYVSGGTWTKVSGPNPKEKTIDETGAQGKIHFSIAVSPTNENILYIGGDRQEHPSPIGDNTFGAAIFRGDASIARNPNVAPSPQWDHATHDIVPSLDPTGGTANGTSPHADSREIVFDANGNLIETDDGGIFRRTSPGNNTGDWFSLAGTLGVTEFHDIAYDSLSDILIGGTQDNGTHYQTTSGGAVWSMFSGGDGGDVAVDNITLAGSNQSIRYSSSQTLLGFVRSVWGQNNALLSYSYPALTVTSGPAFSPLFKTPVELNAIDPQRMLLVGTNGVYESTNSATTISQVHAATPGSLQDAVSYGGYQSGVANPHVFYVGIGDKVAVRTASGGAVTTTDPDAGTAEIRDVVLDSTNWATSFAIDDNQVFRTTNSGGAWSDITGNLMSMAGEALQTIQYIPGTIGTLVVGSSLGVFRALVTALGTWTEVGSNLPNANVYDLQYNATDDVLVAGTLGRGAWTIPNASLLSDAVAPTISSLNPADGATGVAAGANLVITFSETVQKGTGNILIKRSSDDVTVQTIAVADAAVSVVGAVVTINPPSDLASNTGYYVQFPAGTFKDPASNSFAGIQTTTDWNFVTALPVNLSVNTSSSTESGTTEITVTATAASAVSENQTVTLAASGSGVDSGDYTLSNSTITILSGQTTGSVTFTVTNDTLLEGTETATLEISNPSAGIVLGTTTSQNVEITDNESATLAIAATSSVTEQGGVQNVGVVTLNIIGTGTGTFALGSGISITADVTNVAGGTATGSGTDYNAFGTQTVTFGSSTSTGATQNVSLTPVNDRRVEGSETVNLSLGNIGGSSVTKSIAGSSNVTTITDNDTASLAFDDDTSNVSENNSTTSPIASLTLTTNGEGTVGIDHEVTVEVNQTGGTATGSGGDYSYSNGTITFSAGDGASFTRSRDVTIFEDILVDAAETIELSLQSLNDGTDGQVTLGENETHTITIDDDDTFATAVYDATVTGTYSFVVNGTDLQLNLPGGGSRSAPLTQSGTFALNGTGGSDTLNNVGTSGNDTITFNSSGMAFAGVAIQITSIETLSADAGAGQDIFSVVDRPGGVTTLTLNGNTGDDVYQLSGNSLGTIMLDETSGGIDTIDLSQISSAVTLNLGLASTQVVNANLSLNLNTIDSFESVKGGSGNDALTGNGLSNIIEGGAGDDMLNGGIGNDTYVFNTGSQLDTDTISDVSGRDKLDFSSTLAGQGITIDLSQVTVQTVNNNLNLSFGSGVIEKVTGSALADTITGNELNNSITGGSGNDQINGGAGIDSLTGNEGDDSLNGGDGSDTYNFDTAGDLGSDTVDDSSGTDRLIFVSPLTGEGIVIDLGLTSIQDVNSNLKVTLGSSIIEYVSGSALADTITGNASANSIAGGAGNDILNGGDGSDSLTGNEGDDSLNGGDGNDSYNFDTAEDLGSDTVDDSSGTDRLSFVSPPTGEGIVIDLGLTSIQDVNSNLKVTLGSSIIENVSGSALADTITGNASANSIAGGAGNDILNGGDGNDSLTGGSGDDQLNGGTGSDSLAGNEGDDSLNGGDGNDSYSFNTAGDLGSDAVDDSSGTDRLIFVSPLTGEGIVIDLGLTSIQDVNSNLKVTLGSSVIENVSGSALADTITGNASANSIAGGAGNDILNGGDGNDTLSGGVGNDILNGGVGNDRLDGNEGNDILNGGTDNDTINGGDGSDLLLGGIGADALNGGNGDDLLIAGTTSHDANATALSQIFGEWTGPNDYATRIANLRAGTGVPQLLAGTTVSDDGAKDKLTGGLDNDWFFANLVGGTGILDTTDRAFSELVDEL
jgi:Ca2+-binding RTX toxin-like protein/methionine-rich copper-binding protein CopC